MTVLAGELSAGVAPFFCLPCLYERSFHSDASASPSLTRCHEMSLSWMAAGSYQKFPLFTPLSWLQMRLLCNAYFASCNQATMLLMHGVLLLRLAGFANHIYWPSAQLPFGGGLQTLSKP